MAVLLPDHAPRLLTAEREQATGIEYGRGSPVIMPTVLAGCTYA